MWKCRALDKIGSVSRENAGYFGFYDQMNACSSWLNEVRKRKPNANICPKNI